VAADAQAANSLGFTGTPSFQLGKTGGAPQKFDAGTDSEAAPYEARSKSWRKASRQ